MVVQYRNNFIKVFFAAVVNALLVGGCAYYVSNQISTPTFPETTGSFELIRWIIRLLPLLVLLSIILNLWSCYLLAKAKGYSGWFAIAGVFNLLGLGFLCLLPDKRKKG